MDNSFVRARTHDVKICQISDKYFVQNISNVCTNIFFKKIYSNVWLRFCTKYLMKLIKYFVLTFISRLLTYFLTFISVLVGVRGAFWFSVIFT